jgi:hypothetical protein
METAFYPPMPVARPRSLGDDLAPPRPAYFIVIPSLLALSGILSWGMSNNFGFVLGSMVAAVVGLYTLWGWLLGRGPTRFSTLLGMALLIGYGAGALNTWLTLPRGSLTLAAALGFEPGVLARGIGAVLLSSALLYCLGEIFERPVFGRSFQFSIDPRTRLLIYAGTLGMLAGYATHVIGFQGATVAGGHLNPAAAFLVWLYSPLTAIAVTAFLTTPRGRAKVLLGVAALILLLLLSTMGRRSSVYTAVGIVFVLGLARYRWEGSATHKILIILALAGIVVATSLTFMLLRLAGWRSTSSNNASVGKRIEIARKMINSGDAYALAGTSTKHNLETRTFVLGFFSHVLEGSSRSKPALGEDLAKELELSIPSFLYPDKDRYFSEEALVNQQFGFGFADEANSILTGGATDFGLLGALIYPLLLIALVRILYEIASRCFGTIPLMFIALSFVLLFLQTEGTMGGYFSMLRNVFVFALAIAGFMAAPSFRLRSDRG